MVCRSARQGQRYRGASDRDLAPRVSRPSHRPRPTASSDRADRVRAVLQPGASASDAQTADPSAEGASDDRQDPIASGVEPATPRLRTGRLSPTEGATGAAAAEV